MSFVHIECFELAGIHLSSNFQRNGTVRNEIFLQTYNSNLSILDNSDLSIPDINCLKVNSGKKLKCIY